MDETELKNGVLIYLAVKDQTFVIWDRGINDVVANDFGTVPKMLCWLILKRKFQARTY
jgi:uncharacterized membrane protein